MWDQTGSGAVLNGNWGGGGTGSCNQKCKVSTGSVWGVGRKWGLDLKGGDSERKWGDSEQKWGDSEQKWGDSEQKWGFWLEMRFRAEDEVNFGNEEFRPEVGRFQTGSWKFSPEFKGSERKL